MADAKSQAIARENREQQLIERLDRLERVEEKLDQLLDRLALVEPADDEKKAASSDKAKK